MKAKINYKYTLLLFFCFSFMPMRAQEEHPEYFPQGTTWEEAYYREYDGGRHIRFLYLRHTISGDTIVDETPYKRVISEAKVLDSFNRLGLFDYYEIPPGTFSWDNIGPWHWEPLEEHNYCLREENGMVYVRYWHYCPEEVKLYDFNWEEGKQIEEYSPLSGEYEKRTLNGIQETTLLDGTVTQGLRLSDEDIFWIYPADGGFVRIKGIGYLVGLFNYMGIDYELDYSYATQFIHMLNFTRNGILLYEWDAAEYLSAFYSGIEQAKSVSTKANRNTYTITGVQIDKNTTLPAGIYIKNGKKLIVK